MSVKQTPDGRRALEVEFELPGTPEQVWDAVATGPGISSWFVPARFEERDGKAVSMHLDFAGAEISSQITAWDPPRMYAGQGEVYGNSPPIATEWHIEAQAGGTCRVRMVHSLFASTDEWDNQLEGAKGGWAGFLNNLRLYLAHFRGQRGAIMQVHQPVAMGEAEAWAALTAALGVKGLAKGQRWSTPAGTEPMAGVLEIITEDPYDALLRVDEPSPGIVALGAYVFPGGPTTIGMNFYVYGDKAAQEVARVTPVWEAWFNDRFEPANG